MEKYRDYTATDFLLDKDFQDWVRHPSEEKNAYWKQVVVLYPSQEENIENARRALRSLHFKTLPRKTIEDERIWQNVLDRIRAYEAQLPIEKKTKRRSFILSPWMKAAASIVLVIGLVVGFYAWQAQQMQKIVTDYGETKTVNLPDGSQVTLNANSVVSYSPDWEGALLREVWVEGEAFFEVEKVKNNHTAAQPPDQATLFKKFIVHTGNLDIEVLGTAFNVHQRQDKARIVLTEGKVKVSTKKKDKPQEVYLDPGELVEYSAERPTLTKKTVNPEPYTLWQQHQLVFEDVPLEEVALRLEEIFGYEVVFEDPQLGKEMFKGTVPSNDLEVLIEVLKSAYDISIIKNNKKLIFLKK